MEFDQLRAFLHVADLGSQTQAAERLHVSQSALSRRLQQLEGSIGRELFVRTGRGVALTEAGEELRRRVAPILEQLDGVVGELRNAEHELGGEVRFAVPPSIGAALACDVIETLRRDHPRVRMRVAVSLSGGVREGLLRGSLDLGVLYHPIESTELHTETLFRERLELVSALRNAPRGEGLSLREALRLPLVLPGRQHGLRALLELHAMRLGQPLDVVVEADSLRLLVELVRRGVGHTLLPRTAIREELAAGLIRATPIARGAVRRETLLAWPKDGGLTPSAAVVADEVRRWTRARRGRR